MFFRSMVAMALAATTFTSPALAAESHPVKTLDKPLEGHGIYAIWFKDIGEEKVFSLPFIDGGQMVVQWKDLAPAEGKYDWTELDKLLKHYHELGKKATIQVNGSHKPAWLFDKVATLKKAPSEQVDDVKGTLQYWDPIFVNAYKDFVLAYGEHMKQSPYKDAVLGVRLNFNAIGTEHGTIPEESIPLENWTPAPDGHIHNVPWSGKVWGEYKKVVVDAYVKAFTPDFLVFVRNNVFAEKVLSDEQIQMLERGELGLFHTSTEVQPRGQGGDNQYNTFVKFSKNGITPAYAESWADAWGVHGGKTDDHSPFSPAQWNYWRLLADLHCGVSFIAIYGTDLANADDPEFRAAFELAKKYAGYHVTPHLSPGAFVAMREGRTLKGDYTFLMERDTQNSTDKPVEMQGPAEQRFGHWARQIESGGKMVFNLNPEFARSLKSSQLRVVHLDNGSGTIKVSWGEGADQSALITMGNTGKWVETMIPLGESALSSITVTADAPAVLHMVEVQRMQ